MGKSFFVRKKNTSQFSATISKLMSHGIIKQEDRGLAINNPQWFYHP